MLGFKFKYKHKEKKDIPELSIEFEGTRVELIVELSLMITGLMNSLYSKDKELYRQIKRFIMDKNSPLYMMEQMNKEGK